MPGNFRFTDTAGIMLQVHFLLQEFLLLVYNEGLASYIPPIPFPSHKVTSALTHMWQKEYLSSGGEVQSSKVAVAARIIACISVDAWKINEVHSGFATKDVKYWHSALETLNGRKWHKEARDDSYEAQDSSSSSAKQNEHLAEGWKPKRLTPFSIFSFRAQKSLDFGHNLGTC